MKIAVNLLYLEDNINSGLGKHIEDILSGWQSIHVLDQFYLIINEAFYRHYFCPVDAEQPFIDAHLLICPEGHLGKALTDRKMKGQRFFKEFYLNHFVLPELLKNHGFDLVFYPFNGSSNNVSLPFPFVTVIHDLFYKNFPNQKRNLTSMLYAFYIDIKHRMMLNKSTKIIAISEFVKADILKHFPHIDPHKIKVIPNAVVMTGENATPLGIKCHFLLSVSEQAVHKNHLTLLKAFNLIKNKTPCRLVLLGGEREETPKILKYIAENGLESKVDLISKITDGERNWLYLHAELVISPSLHEGFGRPPIEAALLGAMVLSSRETSLPEITCEMLNYYAPACDANALAAKILELLAFPTSPAEREIVRKHFRELYLPARISKLYFDLFTNITCNHNN